ncbi:DUF58 domain-containing protein [Simiduia agarivorans]|uniref:DUF58 domain-containing protein n=1 Tax=Simiduia agarivorans (strain DSM 21679 / JCM 13881 / BCRC 17597 / SA1) TaxID=1117647 RepID=K4KEG1_SIMAS|nr:DUF58 domain-containing protein [Simiduia agarivorans]AFU97439.1 hypothetical protein M5M_01030 [Simiduia agarivorans SA1 = DSM 21679]
MDTLEPKGAYTELPLLLATRQAAKGLSLFHRRQPRSALAGGHASRLRGRGMEFAEVRPYQPGDDVRSIDWRVTARTQKPHTKLFVEERQRPVFFMIDQRAAMFFGSRRCFKSVYAAQLGALLSWSVSASGDKVGGLIAHASGVQDDRAQGSQHAALALIHRLHQCNHQLHSPTASDQESSLASWLSDARRAAKPGATLVLISDFHDWDADCEKSLALIQRHNDTLVFQIHDPLERHWPGDGELSVSAGGEAIALNPALAKTFNRHWLARQQAVEACCARLGIRYYLLDTATPLAPFVQQHFGSRTHR